MLITIGFTADGEIYEKKYPAYGPDVAMSINFATEKLIYPTEIRGRDRNDGFDAPENFVVFECVDRLLEKGYRPEHIELEKEWHLGHDVKSGRADICVSDEDGSMLLIIECKTWGREFDKALKDTFYDGAQLFSYWQQEQSVKWLVLYASELTSSGKLIYKAPTINCSDDPNVLLLSKKDNTIKLYQNAHTVGERYAAWSETYSNEIHDDLIFSEESTAYKINVKPLRKKDLLDFSPNDKIVNKFEEILRHNNVSDKENAFNRLIALFICKLVDETTKDEDDEVEFQFKQGTDTYETLQDRLQRLHRDGMEKFMGEKIYYVSSEYPEQLFQNYTGKTRKKAIADLQNTIRILKFYSNNDFAFKDVHNEELFYQNGKILVEMVQLFEKYRIVYPSKHQFLGDLFEQLLSKGFKQNEGQFFTPMPIARFIWDSLPLDQFIKSERGDAYPKIIDYACGAGHFLTEAVEAVNHYAHSYNNNAWTQDHIYGIEKDYRLARVSKISLFMNGAGEGNIIFGDGLENAPERGIENGIFDILVANPPYSVKDFKQHLQLNNNSFSLLDRIGLNGGEIETLFVERIGQLLKPQGIAAVILPSSILSNDSNSYMGAREQFLENFYIRAIVALGSKTFGATGTNTVIMFLEKFDEPPKQIDLTSDSVDAIMSCQDLTDWDDKDVIQQYMKQIEVPKSIYSAFLDKSLTIDQLNDSDYFKMYVSAFADSTDAKNLTKTKAYKNLPLEEQSRAYLNKLYKYINQIEKEKLFYFALVYKQTTVIIKAPTSNKEQKEFLGYSWSNRKGNEGIQIVTPGGKMYDNSDREASSTLAHAIKDAFGRKVPVFTDEQKTYASVVNTKDMLDFSRVTFNKAIRLTLGNKIQIISKYNFLELGQIAEIKGGNGFPIRFQGNTDENLIPFYKVGDMNTKGNEKYMIKSENYVDAKTLSNIIKAHVFTKGTVIFPKVGMAIHTNKKRILTRDAAIDNNTMGVLITDPSILSEYFYDYLAEIINLNDYASTANPPSISVKSISKMRIPVPPISVQQQIIDECEKIDTECESTRMIIEEYRKQIEDLFNQLDIISNRVGVRMSLADSDKFDITIGKRVLSKQLSPDAEIPVYSANVKEPFGYINDLLITDFSIPSVLWGIDGDWMTSYMPEDKKFYPTDHCGVLRCKTDDLNPCYLEHLLEREGIKAGFSRSYRASIDRIKSLSFLIADRTEQDKIVNQVEDIESKLSQASSELLELKGTTSKILHRYLN